MGVARWKQPIQVLPHPPSSTFQLHRAPAGWIWQVRSLWASISSSGKGGWFSPIYNLVRIKGDSLAGEATQAVGLLCVCSCFLWTCSLCLVPPGDSDPWSYCPPSKPAHWCSLESCPFPTFTPSISFILLNELVILPHAWNPSVAYYSLISYYLIPLVIWLFCLLSLLPSYTPAFIWTALLLLQCSCHSLSSLLLLTFKDISSTTVLGKFSSICSSSFCSYNTVCYIFSILSL